MEVDWILRIVRADDTNGFDCFRFGLLVVLLPTSSAETSLVVLMGWLAKTGVTLIMQHGMLAVA